MPPEHPPGPGSVRAAEEIERRLHFVHEDLAAIIEREAVAPAVEEKESEYQSMLSAYKACAQMRDAAIAEKTLAQGERDTAAGRCRIAQDARDAAQSRADALAQALVRLLDDAVPVASEWDDARSVGTVAFSRAEWERVVKATETARAALKAHGGKE